MQGIKSKRAVNLWLLIAVATAIIYACRWAGFALTTSRMSPLEEQFLQHMPAAVFTAIIILSLSKANDLLGMKLFALAVASGMVWYTRQLGWSILVGLTVLWMVIWIS